MKYPTKTVITHEGKKMMEMAVTKYEKLDKVSDNEFAIDD